jgi:hypothetical protein
MKYCYTFLLSLFIVLAAQSQCYMDQHSTNWNDGWLSCKTSPSPNPIRGNSHWILYNLGFKYALGQSHFWNHNEADGLNNGVKTIVADVSLNGVDWTEWKRFDIPLASGQPVYEGVEGPDFEKIPARYILFTALDNYGGSCAGFSEMKIEVDILSQNLEENNCLSVSAFPNPFSNQLYVNVSGKCIQNATVYLEDLMGRQVSKTHGVTTNQNTITIPTNDLTAGVYFVRIHSEDGSSAYKVIKAE